jgi:hypothetical protein
MPAWITLFCRRSVVDVSPNALKAGILDKDPSTSAGVDYNALADDYGVDEKLVDPALKNLEIASVEPANADGFTRYSLRYTAADTRPVLIHRWTDSDHLKKETVDETIELLTSRQRFIAELLQRTKEVIGIEFGYSQLEDMGVVLAYEVARYLGARGDALIQNDLGKWLIIGKRGGFDPLTRKR